MTKRLYKILLHIKASAATNMNWPTRGDNYIEDPPPRRQKKNKGAGPIPEAMGTGPKFA